MFTLLFNCCEFCVRVINWLESLWRTKSSFRGMWHYTKSPSASKLSQIFVRTHLFPSTKYRAIWKKLQNKKKNTKQIQLDMLNGQWPWCRLSALQSPNWYCTKAIWRIKMETSAFNMYLMAYDFIFFSVRYRNHCSMMNKWNSLWYWRWCWIIIHSNNKRTHELNWILMINLTDIPLVTFNFDK